MKDLVLVITGIVGAIVGAIAGLLLSQFMVLMSHGTPHEMRFLLEITEPEFTLKWFWYNARAVFVPIVGVLSGIGTGVQMSCDWVNDK